jgi:hypothetical protein
MRYIKWITLAVAALVIVLGTLLLPGRLGLPPFVSEKLVVLEPDPNES